jgi:hypothetical protein
MATTLSQSEIADFPPPARLMTLSVHAGAVFANQEKAIHWLQAPNPSLQGKTPLEAAQNGAGVSGSRRHPRQIRARRPRLTDVYWRSAPTTFVSCKLLDEELD